MDTFPEMGKVKDSERRKMLSLWYGEPLQPTAPMGKWYEEYLNFLRFVAYQTKIAFVL